LKDVFSKFERENCLQFNQELVISTSEVFKELLLKDSVRNKPLSFTLDPSSSLLDFLQAVSPIKEYLDVKGVFEGL
jgi:hypothetical protein